MTRRESTLWWTCLAAGCLLLLAPLLLIDLPPLLDYPNHLARGLLLSNDGLDPVFSEMAHSHWAITPNLAIDAILPSLIGVLPVHVAGRAVIGLFVLVPVLGSIAYSTAMFGERGWWSLAACLAAYNVALLMGFLNFMVGIGLGFFVAAAWESWRERAVIRVTVAVAAGLTVAFFCHLMAVLLAVGLIGAYEMERMLRHRVFWARLPALLAILVIPVALYLVSAFQDAGSETVWVDATEKIMQLQVAFANYNLTLDVVTGLLVVGFTSLCIVAGHASVPMRAWLAMGGLAVLYAASPIGFKGTWHVDERLVIMLAFLLFAAIQPRLPRGLAIGTGLLFGGLLIVRMTVLAETWQAYAANLAQFRAVVADLPPGGRVYVSGVSQLEAPDYWRRVEGLRFLSNGYPTDWHIGALMLIEHRAFWPGLFSDPDQQPIVLRNRYRALSDQTHLVINSYRQFAGTDQLGTCGYDYMLLMNAGGEPDLAGFAGRRLILLRANDYAALYRLRKPNIDCE